MEKYGTFVTFQNTETDEVIEIALADEEGIQKYARDSKWRTVGTDEDSSGKSDNSSSAQTKEL
jgi:hypothetical protein